MRSNWIMQHKFIFLDLSIFASFFFKLGSRNGYQCQFVYLFDSKLNISTTIQWVSFLNLVQTSMVPGGWILIILLSSWLFILRHNDVDICDFKWNLSTTIKWIAMTFCWHLCNPQHDLSSLVISSLLCHLLFTLWQGSTGGCFHEPNRYGKQCSRYQ